jgi:hypothetical protein
MAIYIAICVIACMTSAEPRRVIPTIPNKGIAIRWPRIPYISCKVGRIEKTYITAAGRNLFQATFPEADTCASIAENNEVGSIKFNAALSQQ